MMSARETTHCRNTLRTRTTFSALLCMSIALSGRIMRSGIHLKQNSYNFFSIVILLLVISMFSLYSRAQQVSAGGDCCDPSDCCTDVCGSGGTCSVSSANEPCCTSSDCTSGLACVNGVCGCVNSCASPSCPGYSAQECIPTCNPATSCTGCIPPSCSSYSSWNPTACACVYPQSNPSPIVIDTDGTGFSLTSVENGVMFDFYGTGKPIQIAWTAKGSTNGWLALDRNGNGKIDNATELFGNITEQPASDDRNGFLALAVFDQPENGGNGDGIIDSFDAIWSRLLVWIDSNHDGISQPNEIYHLDNIGIHSISLAYRESRRVDQFGNEFRYKGTLNLDKDDRASHKHKGDKVDRIIYDVFLTTVTTEKK